MTEKTNKIIGIVGGMGPYTGLDLAAKILDQSTAQAATEQPSIATLSFPSEISDRTDYILRQKGPNPAYAIIKIIERLATVGAQVIGIPCNTAHAPAIFSVVTAAFEADSGIVIIDMIREVGNFLEEYHPDVRAAGILCTLGAYKTNVYRDQLDRHGIAVVNPEGLQQQEVHDIIYDPQTGIKASPNHQRYAMRTKIERLAIELKSVGAQAIILGCTEIPLVIKESYLASLPVIDPTLILARTLLHHADPAKLRPYAHESTETNL